ncbi:MAG TPA: DUF2272 domain-containing protein [Stellaceae bacterium]|nr:DUF2272 domain-containing protein [Stellaceae bacterium]
MVRYFFPPLLLSLLAACAAPSVPPPGPVPAFAEKLFEPFNRADAVAIALREWRLFGSKVDDTPPDTRPTPLPRDKPERQPGLWQRVGEYWWIGLAVPPGSPVPREEYWTGKHDAAGGLFPAADDGRYAWSAAFISYVMRIAGAGPRFPYAANHASYVNAAAAHTAPILQALAPQAYAPRAGDLICFGRYQARALTFGDLPTAYVWPGHCAIVVEVQPGNLSVIGGNVDDAVTLTHVPVTDKGMLATPDGAIVDNRYPWFVVLRVLYDAEVEPAGNE